MSEKDNAIDLALHNVFRIYQHHKRDGKPDNEFQFVELAKQHIQKAVNSPDEYMKEGLYN